MVYGRHSSTKRYLLPWWQICILLLGLQPLWRHNNCLFQCQIMLQSLGRHYQRQLSSKYCPRGTQLLWSGSDIELILDRTWLPLCDCQSESGSRAELRHANLEKICKLDVRSPPPFHPSTSKTWLSAIKRTQIIQSVNQQMNGAISSQPQKQKRPIEMWGEKKVCNSLSHGGGGSCKSSFFETSSFQPEWLSSRKGMTTNASAGSEEGGPLSHCWWAWEPSRSLWESIREVPQRSETRTTIWSSYAVLGIYPKKSMSAYHGDTYTSMFTIHYSQQSKHGASLDAHPQMERIKRT